MFVGQQYLLLPQVNDTPLHVDPEGGLIGFSCLTHVVGPPLVKSTNSMYPSSQVLQLVDEPLTHSLQLATLQTSSLSYSGICIVHFPFVQTALAMHLTPWLPIVFSDVSQMLSIIEYLQPEALFSGFLKDG